MIRIHTKTKRWGNSLAVVLPQAAIRTTHLKEGDDIDILVLPKEKTSILERSFGSFKFKESVEKLMQEVDEAYEG